MLDVVEQRDSLVALLEEQRLREKEKIKTWRRWCSLRDSTSTGLSITMAERYWPPAIPSFTAGSVKNCRKNRSVSPFDLLGCQQRLQIHSWATKMMFTSSPGTTHCVLSLGSQGSGSVQDVFSFRMREQINLQIFFWSWKRDISILLMLRKSKTNDPTKSQSCFSENKLLCFHGREDVWTDFLNAFSYLDYWL